MKLRLPPSERITPLAAAALLQLRVLPAFGNNAATVDDPIPWASLLIPLLLVVGAGAAATFAVRRWKGAIGGRDGPLQVVHVIAVGPRERLALVKVGARYLVVGITPNHVSRIAELDDIPKADSNQPPIQTTGDPDS
jgi:flagellar biosynthetic protein FliO